MRTNRNILLAGVSAIALTAAFVASGTPAYATVYDWTYGSSPGSDSIGHGTLTTGGSNSPFTMTGITGIFYGVPITGVLNANTLSNDNKIYYPSAPYLDQRGIGFSLSSGETNVNLYYSSHSARYLNYSTYTGGSYTGAGNFTLTRVSATPLPPSLGLFGVGLAGLAGLGLGRRRRKKTA